MTSKYLFESHADSITTLHTHRFKIISGCYCITNVIYYFGIVKRSMLIIRYLMDVMALRVWLYLFLSSEFSPPINLLVVMRRMSLIGSYKANKPK